MAKQRRQLAGTTPTTVRVAENVGSALGKVMAKVDAWLAQRQEIARELREVADRLMAGENPFGPAVTTPSMLAEEVVKREGAPGLKRRRTMSPEARARIAAAQRARWAKQRGESGSTAKGTQAKAKKAKKSGGGSAGAA
jgi:hypothetical protein